MKSHQRSVFMVHILLVILSVTLAFNPRTPSLQIREPEPALPESPVKSVELAPPGSTSSSVSDTAAAVPEASAGQKSGTASEPSRDSDSPALDDPASDPAAASLRASEHDEKPETVSDALTGPYPTQFENPRLGASGLPYVVVAGITSWRRRDSILLIKDRNNPTDGWRLPEGQWDSHEQLSADALHREAWITAGVYIFQEKAEYLGKMDQALDPTPSSEKHVFRADVSFVRREYPAEERFARKWATYLGAQEDLGTHHPEQVVLLKKILQPHPVVLAWQRFHHWATGSRRYVDKTNSN